MSDKTFHSKNPPRGCSRLLWRMPIFFYRIGLGGLLGDRFLLLEHTGRISGKKRQAVVEVVRQDKESNTFIVASGFGEKADWYRNLMQHPEALIQAGRRRIPVTASRLPPDQAETEMLDYARRHPTALRSLAQLMDYPLEETESGYRNLGRILPVVQFSPREPASAPHP